MINRYLNFYYNITELNINYISKESNIGLHTGPINSTVLDLSKIEEFLASKADGLRYINIKDDNGLRFLCSPLQKGYIILGPFILDTDPPPKLGRGHSINIEIPIKSIEKIKSYTQLLCLGDIGTLDLEFSSDPIKVHNPVFDDISKLNSSEIDEVYEIERSIRYLISSGDREGLKKLFTKGLYNIATFQDRFPNNPLRSQKNLAIILNSICRLSAEKGGLPNYLLHNISESFAFKIESETSVDGIKNLTFDMLLHYCDAVHNYGIENHSYKIVKTCQYIVLNLHTKLELDTIASHIGSNPAYLSRLFKKEVGKNITEYIREKRVMEARWMLGNTNESITDIALNLGFEDVNYFSKVFNRVVGVPPREYKKGSWQRDFNGLP